MSDRIGIISLGCAKNLVNSEQMAYLLAESGFELVPLDGEDHGALDAVIVNTCAFIESAQREAIDTIIELGELKAAGAVGRIVVAGCLPERFRGLVSSELPEIDAMVGVGSFGEIVQVTRAAIEGTRIARFADSSAPLEETHRLISTAPGWAYIKIAEGCDNRCAYCVIPSIRGRYRSRSMENIVEEARELAESGVRELIVVAQDITRYGTDLYGERRLSALLRELCEIAGLEWIRLHYLYPDQIDDELIDTIAAEPKIVKYLDIPIQHIDDGILRAMNRRGSGAEIRELFSCLRERIPGLVLRTSVIVGLPGEGEREFEALAEFFREAKIERAGVFEYSPEEGTAAAEMDGRPEPEVAAHRADLIREIASRIMDDWNSTRVGMTLDVLMLGYDAERDCLYGRSTADSPDIDGLVYFTGEAALGEIAPVLITGAQDGELWGEAVAV